MTAAVLVGTMRFKDGQMRYWRYGYLLLPWVVVDCCSPHHRAAACDPARICCCPPASRCRLGAEQIKLIQKEFQRKTVLRSWSRTEPSQFWLPVVLEEGNQSQLIDLTCLFIVFNFYDRTNKQKLPDFFKANNALHFEINYYL